MTTATDSPIQTLAEARTLHRAGISVVPIRPDGSKRPAVPWEEFTSRLPTDNEIAKWFSNGSRYGIGAVGGKISGNLEHLDFDHDSEVVCPDFVELVGVEAPSLIDRLNFRQTPGGFHITYRCAEVEIPGNTKIAEKLIEVASGDEVEIDGKKYKPHKDGGGWFVKVCLIETRGEGGQCLVPGTPGHCHPSGKEYKHFAGVTLANVPTITAAERTILWRCARSFDQTPPEPASHFKYTPPVDDLSPGDDFNNRGPDWADLLDGWSCVHRKGNVRYWKRPGKDGPGWSATTGYCKNPQGNDQFAVFSSNAHPFEGPRAGKNCSCYTKFAVYTILKHGGDFSKAAKELAALGYGEKSGSHLRTREASANGATSSNLTSTNGSSQTTGGGKLPQAFAFEWMGGADFFAGEFTESYLIEDVLVAGQPCIVAAPKKALKTTLCIDMFLSLAAGDYFCGGKFRVPVAVNVGIMSGESGRATLQNAAKRITQTKRPDGWTAEELARQHWCFRVARLDDAEHLKALRDFIVKNKLAVLIIDPTYLALPIGDGAGNLFAVGKLLLELSEIGQETGCTLILVHHLRKNVADPFIPAELEDMAWSGFAEWARQWLLISRREKYLADGEGQHKLWLNIGGSAGHSSLWAVDVKEGKRPERYWNCTVTSASVARDAAKEAQAEERQSKKSAATEANRKDKRERAMKAFKRFPDGETQSKLAAAAGMSNETFSPILGEMLEESTVVPCKVTKGKNQEYDGFRLKPVTLL